jgi:nucleotide-binding universal stress UspA family protein
MKKLVIGYDGSPVADAAIEDLVHASLPPPVDALVLSVADVWLPSEEAGGDQPTPKPSSSGVAGGEGAFGGRDTDWYALARAVLESSHAKAEQGAQRLARLFPDWRVHPEAMADSPGWGLVDRARTWKADLIVVGAHSHTPLQRFFFGSAASAVVMQTSCSVRISRPRKHSPDRVLRIVLAVDGSRESEQASREMASRTWPSGTEIRVLTVLDSKMETAFARVGRVPQPWLQEHFKGTKETLTAMAVKFAEDLRAGGRTAESHMFEGDPKKILLHEAEAWQADCIFLGARGLNHGRHWLLGSVASAVASRAHCSVEIVRAV